MKEKPAFNSVNFRAYKYTLIAFNIRCAVRRVLGLVLLKSNSHDCQNISVILKILETDKFMHGTLKYS